MIRPLVALIALAFILIAVNASILDKEKHLDTGREVFLELAPVDPRSLMQGDYMALRFEVAGKLRGALPRLGKSRGWWGKVDAEDGWIVLDLDERRVGRFAGVATTPANSSEQQINVAFRVRSGTIKFATNAFFFQEGTAGDYEQARFGEFRVNEEGEPLLVGLLDDNMKRLGEKPDSR